MKQQKWFSFAASVLMISLCAGMVGAESAAEEYPQYTYTYINPIYADIMTEEDLVPLPEIMPVSDLTEPVGFEEAARHIRQTMIERDTYGSVMVWVDELAEFDSLNPLFDLATEHGEHPAGGDYLTLQMAYSGSATPFQWEDGRWYYQVTYSMTHYTTAEEEAFVNEEVARLTEQWSEMGMNKYQTICTIYDYICENVVYDHTHKDDSSYKHQFTAYAALHDKTAVCQGYASLFYRLALEMGIDCRVISGIGNGGPHGWNIVELNGVYYTIDSTWDEWADEEEFKGYDWFMLSEDTFYTKTPSHVRDEKYTSVEFTDTYPLSDTDFLWSSDGDSGIYGNIAWTLSDDGILTLSGEGDMPDPLWDEFQSPWYDCRDSITKAVVGEGITSIGGMAFYDHKNLSEIDIQGDITFIGHHALSGTALTSFTVPNTVEDIAEGVFEVSPFTEILVEDPAEGQEIYFISKDGVLFTGDKKCLFAYPRAKAGTSYTVPDGVVALYTTAFCTSELEEINLPSTLVTINDWAFGDCQNLKSLEIPANVGYIGGCFIFNTPSLKSITFLGDSPVPMIGWDAFSGNEGHTVIYYPADAEGWTNAVQTREDGSRCWQPADENGNPNNPELLALPAGITTVVSDAAVEGTDLTWSLAEDGVLTISGEGYMPDNWGEGTPPWEGYRAMIAEVAIEEGVRSVADGSFAGYSRLTKVSLPDSLERIGHDAFAWGTGLTEITIPASVTDCGAAFTCNGQLENIFVADDNPIYYDDNGVLFAKNEEEGWVRLINYPGGKSNTFYMIPDGVTEIGGNSLKGAGLESITIPASVQRIEGYSFSENPLTEIVIPENVSCIEDCVFENCDSLSSVKFEGQVPDEFGDDVFAGTADNFVIQYPEAYGWPNVVYPEDGDTFWQPDGNPAYRMEGYTPDDYDPNGIWESGVIEETWIDDETRGKIQWSVTNSGVLTISGSGEIPDYDWDAPWYNCRSIVHTVNIGCGDGDKITRVGSTAFVEMNHLNTVNFGDSVTRIGHKAFEGTALTTFTLPAAVEEIDGGAFARMYNVTAFDVEDGNESFKADSGVLYSADGMILYAYPLDASAKEFTVPTGVKEIAPHAFEASPNLVNVILNDGLETIHGGAFDWSQNLKTINIPASVRFIGWGAFEYIDTLETVTFEGPVPVIEPYVFNTEVTEDDMNLVRENFVIKHPNGYGWNSVVYTIEGDENTYWQPNENPVCHMEAYDVEGYDPDGILDSGVIEETWIDDENRGEIQWSVTNSGKLTLTGSGEIPNYNGDNRAPWYKYAEMICEISIGEDIPVIGEEAFCGLTALKSLTIPDTVTDIRMFAFSDCYSLESLDLGNGVKSISHKAFAWTAVSDFTVPASVEHLDDGAFAVMMNVSKYKVHEDNPHYYTDDDGVIFCRETNILAAFPPASDITEYEVPDNAMGVYGHAFENCGNLTKVTLPYILPGIHFTFSGCESLTEVYFRSGLPGEIGDCIFGERMEDYHEHLVLYFPYGTKIGDVTLNETNETKWNPYAGREDDNGREYTVKGWNYTVPEGELVEGDFGEVHWSLDFDGLLTISPIGETGVIHEPEDEFPWYNCRDLITKLSVEEGVTEIGGWAFHDLYNLTEADIAASVKRISHEAFRNCENLKTVNLTEGLEMIGHKAFDNTAVETLTIPTTVKEIESGAFARMYSLTEIKMAEESEHFKAVDGVLYTEDGKGLIAYPTNKDGEFYEIPEGVEEIWGHAFEATKVRTVVFPETLIWIGGCAFYDGGLTNVTFPVSLQCIDSSAFTNCYDLSEVKFFGGAPEVWADVFSSIYWDEENQKDVTENLDVTIYYPIGLHGWADCVNEERIWSTNGDGQYPVIGYEPNPADFPSGSIEETDIQWSITADGTLIVTGSGEIPDYSWDHEGNPAPWKRYANIITGISIGNEITRIGSKAFAQLWNIQSVDVPGNVEEIGESAFRFYDSLTEITLHDGLRLIEHGAFGDAKVDGLTIPATVEEMHGGAISFMPNVRFYEVDGNSEHFCNDEYGVVYTADGRELVAYPPQHDVDSYTVAAGTERIKDSAFTNCEYLKSVTLPTTLKVLEGWIFIYCDNLETVTFKSGIPEEVGPWLFGETEEKDNGEVYNPKLPTLEFPAGSAGWEIFKAGDTTTWTPNENFEYTVAFYDGMIASGNVTDTITWQFDVSGVLTVSGTGAIPDYDLDNNINAPWYTEDIRNEIRTVVFEGNITRIGNQAFRWLENLNTVTVPGTVKDIGENAFEGCRNLTSVTLEEGILRINGGAFGCTGATELTIPASVEYMHEWALTEMYNAAAFTVAEGNQTYWNDEEGVIYTAKGDGSKVLFRYPAAREGSYTIAPDTKEIGSNSFGGAKVNSVTIPFGVQGIGAFAFGWCDNLTEVEIPASVKIIIGSAFTSCPNLTKATFYSPVSEKWYAPLFENVSEEFTIYYPAGVDGWTEGEWSLGEGTPTYKTVSFVHYGDVSSDGVLDENDADLLNQYFAGWPVVINHEALDFNNDGVPSRADAMYLARYLAGWAGYDLKH